MPVGKSSFNKKRKSTGGTFREKEKKPAPPVNYETLPQLKKSTMLAACHYCRSHNLANITTATTKGNKEVVKCGRCGKLHKPHNPQQYRW